MKINHTALLFFTSLILSGCNNQTPTSSCSSSDTQKLIESLITEQSVKLTTEKRYDLYDGSFIFGATKIRASLAQIQMAIENIKTVKQESDSNKSFCTGQLKVTLPATMLTEIEQIRDSHHQLKIAQYARQLNIENSNNIYTKNIEYTVRPNSHGKDPQVDFESTAWAHFLDEITTTALLKPTVEGQENTYAQTNQQAIEPLKPEENQLKSDEITKTALLKPTVDGQENNYTHANQQAAEQIKARQEKQGLDKLNKELLEAEQAEKELSLASKNQLPPQPVTPQVPFDTRQASPSFNCTKATKATEITICTYPELAALDVENMLIYKKAKATDPVATNAIWKESIRSKYACGTDADCIKTAYNRSIRNYGCVAAEATSNCGDTLQ